VKDENERDSVMATQLCEMETVGAPSGKRVSKIERYGWILRDVPGVFMEIDKKDLLIDHNYQREEVNMDKVRSIARAWSWAGCGSISVALRHDGRFFVFDGQHRTLAAKTRSDIVTMPCMVFECESIAQEAAGFLVTNSERKPVTAVDKFRSLVFTDDSAAIKVKEILEDLGLEISKTATRPGQIKCVSRCLAMATAGPEEFSKAITLAERLCRDVAPVHEDIVAGFFHLQRRHKLLDDSRFVRRVIDVGHTAIVDGIRRSRVFRQKGGDMTLMEGILLAVNHKLRHRFLEARDQSSDI